MQSYSRGYLLRAVILHLGRRGRDWLKNNAGVVMLVALVPVMTSAEVEKTPYSVHRAATPKSAAPRESGPAHRMAAGKIKAAPEHDALYLVVRASARLREYPDESSGVFKVLKPGTRVEATDFTPDSRWTKVRELKDGLIGWIWSSLLDSDLPKVQEVVSTKDVVTSIANARGLTESQVETVRKLDDRYQRKTNEIVAPKLQVRSVPYGRDAVSVKLYPAYPTVIRFFLDGKPAKLVGSPYFGDKNTVAVDNVDGSAISVALSKSEDTSQTGWVRLVGYPDLIWVKLVGKTVQDVDRPVGDQQVDIQVSSPDTTVQRNEHYLESVATNAEASFTSKVKVLAVDSVRGSQREIAPLKVLQAWISVSNGKLVVQAPQGWVLYDSPSTPTASGVIGSTGERFYEFAGRPDVLTFRSGVLIASVRLAM